MSIYRAIQETPEKVQKALDIADQLGFTSSCRPEVGRILRILAAHTHGVVGEIGTGCGEGTAWLASGLPERSTLVTVELDPERARVAERVLSDDSRVTVLQGDWHDILLYGPFHLLFADGGRAKEHAPEALLRALEIGGLLLLDDMTPEALWPEEWRSRPDPVRAFWLNDRRVAVTEILTTPGSSLLLLARIA